MSRKKNSHELLRQNVTLRNTALGQDASCYALRLLEKCVPLSLVGGPLVGKFEKHFFC